MNDSTVVFMVRMTLEDSTIRGIFESHAAAQTNPEKTKPGNDAHRYPVKDVTQSA